MTITVALVTRNRAEDVRECINSLLVQDLIPNEILVIDNASEDNTKEVVDSFSSEIIKYIYCSDIGVSFARNAALYHAVGDVLCYLDDDSVAEKDWTLQIVKCFEKYKCAGIQGFIDNYYPKHAAAILTQFQRDMIEELCTTKGYVTTPTFCAAGNLSFDLSKVKKYDLEFNTNLKAGEEQDYCRRLMERNEQITYLKDSIIYHKWKKNSKEYLIRRYKTGISQASQQKLVSESVNDRFTSGLSKVDILKKLYDYSLEMPFYLRFKLFSLLILSNIVKKIGYLKA